MVLLPLGSGANNSMKLFFDCNSHRISEASPHQALHLRVKRGREETLLWREREREREREWCKGSGCMSEWVGGGR